MKFPWLHQKVQIVAFIFFSNISIFFQYIIFFSIIISIFSIFWFNAWRNEFNQFQCGAQRAHNVTNTIDQIKLHSRFWHACWCLIDVCIWKFTDCLRKVTMATNNTTEFWKIKSCHYLINFKFLLTFQTFLIQTFMHENKFENAFI